jgi:major membrane immunogen (membrane-anchored lipoprotein)
MRHTLLVAAIAVAALSSGCSKDPKTRLQGKWLGDSITHVDGAQSASALAWVQGVTFEFSGTKMTVTVPNEQPRVGEFDIEDARKDRVTIRVARDSGGTDSTTFRFAQEDRLHWDLGDGREVVLTRLP